MHQQCDRLRTDLAPAPGDDARAVPAVNGSGGCCHGRRGQAEELSYSGGRRAALIEAAQRHDTTTLLAILGPEAKSIVSTGDPVSDRESGEHFVKSYEEAHTLVQSGDTKVVLQIGKDEWPFPIPLIKGSAGWRFDTPAGKEEIRKRRIGRNELDVIQVCLAYVDAQREYYVRNPGTIRCCWYAPKFISTKGKRDGLYWETSANEPPSPWGPLVARARREGYKRAAGKPVPYHGYYYKMLTRQGPDAPGGAYDYMVRGKMIGGFALVAYPAQYGSSGIMTFIVNHDGVVYERLRAQHHRDGAVHDEVQSGQDVEATLTL